MAIVYKEGTRYVRSRVTGAVFNYKESLVGLGDLEVVVADAEGNLQKAADARKEPSPQLAPTKTPEKKTVSTTPAKAAADKKPTLVPAEDK